MERKDDPKMCLTQGNSADQPGFSMMLIIVYNRLGHRAKFVLAWTGNVFLLVTILYIDNSYILYLALVCGPDSIDFFEQV